MTAPATHTTDTRPVSPFADDPAAHAHVARVLARNPKACPLEALPDVHPARIPRHIAFILDGNGRWARQQGMPRILGHRHGALAVREIIKECGRLGVEYITLYSFSLENWKRPADEVAALMSLYQQYLASERTLLMENNVRFRQIGRRGPGSGMPDVVMEQVEALERETAGNTAATLNLAINYSGRAEITDAARELARRCLEGTLRPEDISEEHFAGHLTTAGVPDPDLLVRTAGEMRVSNYLLWQISYSEFYVTQTLWPDFSVAELHKAIREYARRERRFGGVTASPIQP